MYVARTEETADRLRSAIPFQNDHGVPSEFLTPEEATEYVVDALALIVLPQRASVVPFLLRRFILLGEHPDEGEEGRQ